MYTQEQIARIWLQCAQHMTWQRTRKAVERYGSAAEMMARLNAEDEQALGAPAYRELCRLRDTMPRVLTRLTELDISVLCQGDAAYPMLLSQIIDPPHALFVRGCMPQDGERRVAIVGSRRCTRYGIAQAGRIARELSERGVTVVSGMARGIDTAAHIGALEGGGGTIAVLGCGVNVVYPPENEALYQRIIRSGGAVISEYPPASKPEGYRFPIRNRIISGLSAALLLVEARRKSGTLSTVEHALKQGREVFALPGNVDSEASEIPNMLLHEGAAIARRGLDILLTMEWAELCEDEPSVPYPHPPLDMDGDALAVWRALEAGPLDMDALTEAVNMQAAALSVVLTDMELSGQVERSAAGLFSLQTKNH